MLRQRGGPLPLHPLATFLPRTLRPSKKSTLVIEPAPKAWAMDRNKPRNPTSQVITRFGPLLVLRIPGMKKVHVWF